MFERNSVPVTHALAGVFIAAALIGGPAHTADESKYDEARFLLEGFVKHASQFRSGSGEASYVLDVKTRARGLSKPEVREKHFTFSFQGEKRRAEINPISGSVVLPPQIISYDGSLYYDAFVEREAYPGSMDRAFIRERDEFGRGERSGVNFDYTGFLGPQSFLAVDDLEKFMDDTAADIDVADVEGGRRKITFYHTNRQNTEESHWVYEFVIDPNQGYGMVMDSLRIDEKLIYEERRTFLPQGDAWTLDTYHLAETDAETGEIGGTVDVKIESFVANATFDDDHFNLHGFGMAPKTRVYDERIGAFFTLDSSTAVDTELNAILTAAPSDGEVQVVPEGSAVETIPGPTGDLTEAIAQTEALVDDPAGNGAAAWVPSRWISVAFGAVGLVAVGALMYARRRRASGTTM